MCKWPRGCRRKARVWTFVSRPGMVNHAFGKMCKIHAAGLQMYFGSLIKVLP